jgi:hypothetical protein
MKRTFTTINDLHGYLVGMHSGRPGDHHPRIQHARKVDEIVFELAGLMLWRADANTIEVGTRMTQSGTRNEANMFWFTDNANPYALVYRAGSIALCDRNRGGAVLGTFHNASTRQQIKAAFAAL